MPEGQQHHFFFFKYFIIYMRNYLLFNFRLRYSTFGKHPLAPPPIDLYLYFAYHPSTQRLKFSDINNDQP